MTDDMIKKVRRLLPRFLSIRLLRQMRIVEISARESRRLNYLYRKKDKSADVLSFRYGQDVSRRSPRAKADYGEILVCPEVIRREAKEQGNIYKYQMTWMIIHGMLHLAGMHHERSGAMRKKFERIEKSILRKLF